MTVSEGPLHSSNVIVLYRGYIFTFDMILPDESILTPQELAYQLMFIEKWCQSQETDGPGIGALTVAERSVWAKNRQYLRSLHPENAKILDLIENAISVYAFEDSEPLSPTDVSADHEIAPSDSRERHCGEGRCDVSSFHVPFFPAVINNGIESACRS